MLKVYEWKADENEPSAVDYVYTFEKPEMINENEADRHTVQVYDINITGSFFQQLDRMNAKEFLDTFNYKDTYALKPYKQTNKK